MRTALADAVLKNRIMTAHQDWRHAYEDYGHESQEALDARQLFLEAIGQGFQIGLTVADIHRLTDNYAGLETGAIVKQAVEAAPVAGPVLEPITPKPKRTRRPRTKAIETATPEASE